MPLVPRSPSRRSFPRFASPTTGGRGALELDRTLLELGGTLLERDGALLELTRRLLELTGRLERDDTGRALLELESIKELELDGTCGLIDELWTLTADELGAFELELLPSSIGPMQADKAAVIRPMVKNRFIVFPQKSTFFETCQWSARVVELELRAVFSNASVSVR